MGFDIHEFPRTLHDELCRRAEREGKTLEEAVRDALLQVITVEAEPLPVATPIRQPTPIRGLGSVPIPDPEPAPALEVEPEVCEQCGSRMIDGDCRAPYFVCDPMTRP